MKLETIKIFFSSFNNNNNYSRNNFKINEAKSTLNHLKVYKSNLFIQYFLVKYAFNLLNSKIKNNNDNNSININTFNNICEKSMLTNKSLNDSINKQEKIFKNYNSIFINNIKALHYISNNKSKNANNEYLNNSKLSFESNNINNNNFSLNCKAKAKGISKDSKRPKSGYNLHQSNKNNNKKIKEKSMIKNNSVVNMFNTKTYITNINIIKK